MSSPNHKSQITNHRWGSALSAAACAPAHVRRELAGILSQPDYNRSYGPNPVDHAWKWVLDLIMRLAGWLSKLFGFRMVGAGRIASIVFACLVIVAFFWLLALVIRKLVGQAGDRGEEKEAPTGPFQLPSAGPLIREAGVLAEGGDYRGAFRSAYLASISRLDEAGALRFERSRTNWEYVRELKTRGLEPVSDTLRPLTLDFDRKIYGREPCTRADYENAIRAYEAVSGQVAA